MKKVVINIFTCLLMVLSFSSCNDQLKEDVYGSSATEPFLKGGDKNAFALVGAVYSELKWLPDHWCYWGLNTLTTDEAVCPVRNPSNHWGDSNFWYGLNTHEWDYTGTAFINVWYRCNAGAVLCNKVIKQLETYKSSMTEEAFNRYIAELKVTRCYYYYTLFDCFGRIPYTEQFSADYVPLSTPEETWEKLVACLKENAPYLPLANNPSKATNYGRATRGMAYTLLARLYLNAASYDVSAAKMAEYNVYNGCVAACDSVINSGVYSIEPDFFSNFAINNGGSDENIFTIIEDGTANDATSSYNMMNKLRITMLTLHYNHQQVWSLKTKPWNGFCAREDFMAKYKEGDFVNSTEGDYRGVCDATLGTKDTKRRGWFVGPVYNAAGDAVAKDENGTDVVITEKFYSGANYSVPATSVNDVSWNSGARCLKYEVDKTGTYTYCENDFVVFRYADVLYMKAEALLRGATNGDLATLLATADFQLMRTRVNRPAYTVGTLTLDEIYDERGREFAWEGVRRRDMIRFGKYDQSWQFKTNSDSYRKWFPIHKETLAAEPRWTQNPGY